VETQNHIPLAVELGSLILLPWLLVQIAIVRCASPLTRTLRRRWLWSSPRIDHGTRGRGQSSAAAKGERCRPGAERSATPLLQRCELVDERQDAQLGQVL